MRGPEPGRTNDSFPARQTAIHRAGRGRTGAWCPCPHLATARGRRGGTRRISDRQAKVALAIPDGSSRMLVRTPRCGKKKRRQAIMLPSTNRKVLRHRDRWRVTEMLREQPDLKA